MAREVFPPVLRSAEVTLTGTVDGRLAKRLAEDVTENVSGVRHVHNQIRVEHSAGRAMEMPHSGTTASGTGTSGTSTSTRSK